MTKTCEHRHCSSLNDHTSSLLLSTAELAEHVKNAPAMQLGPEIPEVLNQSEASNQNHICYHIIHWVSLGKPVKRYIKVYSLSLWCEAYTSFTADNQPLSVIVKFRWYRIILWDLGVVLSTHQFSLIFAFFHQFLTVSDGDFLQVGFLNWTHYTLHI